MYVWVAKIVAYDPGLPGTRTLYYATKGRTTTPSETPANTHLAPRLLKAPTFNRTMFSGGATFGPSRTSFGDLVLANDDGGLDALADYAFDGRAVTLYYGSEDAVFPSGYTTVAVATMSQAVFSTKAVTIKLRGRETELDLPLQSTKYAGDNVLPDGLEGGEELKDKPKPYLLGDVFNVPAVCVNPSKLIYQVNDGAVQDITAVRDQGVPLRISAKEWTARTSGVATDINDVCSNDTHDVAVGDSGVILYSTDNGVTWAAASSPGFGATNINAVTYDATIGKWVAGGDSSKLGYATDPTGTWTQITGGSNPLTAGAAVTSLAASGEGTYIATVAPDGSVPTGAKIVRSTNGTSFSTSTHSFSSDTPWEVAYSARQAKWVACGSSGIVQTSTDDGATFGSADPISNLASPYKAIHWCDHLRLWVMGTTGVIATSPDATARNWTVRYTNTTDSVTINKIHSTPATGLIAVGGVSAGWLLTSADGAVWTAQNSQFTTSPGRGVFVSDDHVVAVADGGKISTGTVNGTYANATDLEDDSLAPAPGTVKVYLTGGYFRLGSPPVGLITADVLQGAAASNRTAGQLFAAVMTKMGKSSDYSTSDVTALDSANSAVLGYWSGLGEVRASDVLSQIAQSVGAWWGPDNLGVYRIAIGPDPTGTSALTITESMVAPAGGITRTPSNNPGNGLPVFRYTIRYRKNYAVQTTDLAGGVTEEDRALYARPFSSTADEDTAVQTKHLLAPEAFDETLLQDATDAADEATRRLTLYKVDRWVYPVPVRIKSTTLGVDMGDTVTLEHSRTVFDAGDLAVLTIALQPDSRTLALELWG